MKKWQSFVFSQLNENEKILVSIEKTTLIKSAALFDVLNDEREKRVESINKRKNGNDETKIYFRWIRTHLI